MGTGAVYVTLSGLQVRPNALRHVETIFFFLNMVLFLLNTSTLLLQAICKFFVPDNFFECFANGIDIVYPKKAWRLVTDPISGIFVPLIVIYLDSL
jgi:hypothetical protein